MAQEWPNNLNYCFFLNIVSNIVFRCFPKFFQGSTIVNDYFQSFFLDATIGTIFSRLFPTIAIWQTIIVNDPSARSTAVTQWSLLWSAGAQRSQHPLLLLPPPEHVRCQSRTSTTGSVYTFRGSSPPRLASCDGSARRLSSLCSPCWRDALTAHSMPFKQVVDAVHGMTQVLTVPTSCVVCTSPRAGGPCHSLDCQAGWWAVVYCSQAS